MISTQTDWICSKFSENLQCNLYCNTLQWIKKQCLFRVHKTKCILIVVDLLEQTIHTKCTLWGHTTCISLCLVVPLSCPRSGHVWWRSAPVHPDLVSDWQDSPPMRAAEAADQRSAWFWSTTEPDAHLRERERDEDLKCHEVLNNYWNLEVTSPQMQVRSLL